MQTIRISGHTYELHLVKPDKHLSAENVGRFSIKDHAITLDSTQRPAELRSTLLHELIHAADIYHCGDTLSEEQVLGIERGLWAIFADNPGLADIIFKGRKL
jgi:hypothetical protein